jgi:hypothetical protein
VANAKLVRLLQQGTAVWNKWREQNRHVHVDLTQANLAGAQLYGARLEYAELGGAIFRRADLSCAQMPESWLVEADMRFAILEGTNFRGATLYKADLTGARLKGASLFEADLRYAKLKRADLAKALLEHALLIGTKLQGANLKECHVYGTSAWDVEFDRRTKQVNLIITPQSEHAITVDNLKVAQFVYLILNNREIRDVIDTITSKAVLILGRFLPPERKTVLDKVRDALRVRRYVPIVFDFEPSKNRDLTETIQVLANMSRFVIADLTDARSIPQELSHIIPNLPSVPIQPVLAAATDAYAMFDHWRPFPWVLKEFKYTDCAHLLRHLDPIIKRIERRRSLGAASVQLDDAKREIARLKKQLSAQARK